jgi:predicted kinase
MYGPEIDHRVRTPGLGQNDSRETPRTNPRSHDEPARARIEALQWQLGQQLLARGLCVIIEWGTWSRSERDTLRLRARELGAAVELHFLNAPVEVLYERVRQRGAENPPVERHQIAEWLELFEAPDPQELALFDAPSQ